MSKLTQLLLSKKYGWVMLVLALLLLNILSSRFFFRLDMTKEKRFTLSNTTKELLKELPSDIHISVFLKGEFPAGFKKLANSTQDFLSLLKDQNSAKVNYSFIAPHTSIHDNGPSYGDSLLNMGAIPINLTVQRKEGETSNIIFPVAIIEYEGRIAMVNLYGGANSRITQDEINSAESLMEYQFTNAIQQLANPKKPVVAYATGNGEPIDARTYDLVQQLKNSYEFFTFDLQEQPIIPSSIDVLLVVKPTIPFTEEQKLKLDQYIMQGGKMFCFIDNLIAESDSISFKEETIAYDRNLNLNDLLFRYGARVNPDLIMDLQCEFLPFVVGGSQDQPQMEFLKWNYYPLLQVTPGSFLSKNTGYIGGRFVNSIDTIAVEGVQKKVLLQTSLNARSISTPALISLNENKNVPQHEQFNRSGIPAAVLLEGNFTSLYQNRVSAAQRSYLQQQGQNFIPVSNSAAKIIIAGDGDIALNEFSQKTGPLPIGWNKFTYAEYENQTNSSRLFIPVANADFLRSGMEYLINNAALNELRNKETVLRLLNTQKVQEDKSFWQIINIILPILAIILFGLFYQYFRKLKYSGK